MDFKRITLFSDDPNDEQSADYVWVQAWLERWKGKVRVVDYSTGGWEHLWDVEAPPEAAAEVPDRLLCASAWSNSEPAWSAEKVIVEPEKKVPSGKPGTIARAEMTEMEERNLSVVRSYLAAIEAGATGDALARFFAPDATQVELPNRLNPQGAQSDLATILARADQGRKVLKSQSFEVKSETVQGARVAIEAVWTGVLAVPLGALAAGATLRAHFAMFFELADGRILTQRNYDCFEPW